MILFVHIDIRNFLFSFLFNTCVVSYLCTFTIKFKKVMKTAQLPVRKKKVNTGNYTNNCTLKYFFSYYFAHIP